MKEVMENQGDGKRGYKLLTSDNGCLDGCGSGITNYSETEYNGIGGAHDDQEGFYVLSGSGFVLLDGVEYEICEGDSIMVAPHVHHTFRSRYTIQPLKVLWFHSALTDKTLKALEEQTIDELYANEYAAEYRPEEGLRDKTPEEQEASLREREKKLAERTGWLYEEKQRLKKMEEDLSEDRKLMDIQKGMLERQQGKSNLLKSQLENQKKVFDEKWQMLEIETRRLKADQDKFNREKLMYKDKVYREARKSMSNAENVKIFFKGVSDTDSLKKRYKELLKIYHPDNKGGDKDLLTAINTEYERLSRYYLGT